MTILIIGGTGSTGSALAKLLHAAGHSVLLTSRSGKAPEPFKAVAFDWFDKSTFENPFKAGESVDRIYLIGPPVMDPIPIAKPFIDLAVSKGVKRFVLLSVSLIPAGGDVHGKLHQYFIDIGVEYASLRATWFMKNFAEPGRYLKFIRDDNYVLSLTEDGKIPFVAVEDIAQAAFEVLTSDEPVRKEIFVLGPQLLTMDEVAKLLSTILGREIVHKRASVEEHTKIYNVYLESIGIPGHYSEFITKAEQSAAAGAEEAFFNAAPEKKFIGKVTLEQYFRQNAALWK